MKKTILFSNIVGDIFSSNEDNLRFNNYMEEYLINNIKNNKRLVFINAPGLGNENNYLKNIIKCFSNINIKFDYIFEIDFNSSQDELKEFIEYEDDIVYFLMGGNPITQMEIINKFNLNDRIKNHNGLVIGFCAGAINLSKYSIITTDEDFNESMSYKGIERVNLIIEPHYNNEYDEIRNTELLNFSKLYNQKIYAIPDESIVVVEDDIVTNYGKIYYIESE